MPTTRTPTMDQVRHAIDSGHTHDKVAAHDPAAAPLGTDEEAAGTPTAIASDVRDTTEPSRLVRQWQRAAGIVLAVLGVIIVGALLS